MRRLVRGGLCGILVVLLAVTTVPQAALAGSGAQQNGAQSATEQQAVVKVQDTAAQRAAAAVEKFTDAMSKFISDTSNLSQLSSFMTRFGGVTNAASGVIGILQMAGIIQDPMMAKIGKVLDTVKSIEDQINVVDKKLDGINQQLVNIAVRQEEKERNSKADQRLKNWQDFLSKYREPLKDKMNEYTTMVNEGIAAWWKQPHSSHKGVNVIYAKTKNGIEQTYSSKEYANGQLPTAGDNGEAVLVNNSFAVPANLIPDTAKITYNPDTYRNDFVGKMATTLVNDLNKAAKDRHVKANNAFFTAWNNLKDNKAKQTQAKKYANDILNAISYQVSCDVMSKNSKWVVDVTNKYENYCNNILEQNSGVNARLQAMYYTHGFEGEIKDDIEKFLDGMVAQAGLYGQFALSCVGQCNLKSTAEKEAVRKLFTDTVLSLSDKKKTAIRNHDNYCYITSTLISPEKVTAKSTVKINTESNWRINALRGHTSTDWQATVPNILDDVYSQVLYRQYKALNQGTKSFAEYLTKYGAFKDKDYTGQIVTKYIGAETFPLDEGITMKAWGCYPFDQKFFTNGKNYRIDVGNISKVEREYFYIHDRVKVNEINMGTGELTVNKTAGARAFYGEAHGRWHVDEPWLFYTDGVKMNYDVTGHYDFSNKLSFDFTVLKLTPEHNLNGDNEPENPFFAWDQSMFIKGVSDWIGPSYENNDIHITSLKLNKSKFIYTGKAIKPKLTVKAGKKVVPAKNYTVKYLDNKAVGTGKVIVKGKGKYAGTISKSFTILSKNKKAVTANTESKMVAKGKKAMTLSWPVVKNADGYDVFFARCNHHGKKVKMKKVKTFNSNMKTSYTKKGLKKGVSYKARVKAFVKVKGKKKYIMTSPLLHAYSGNGTKKFTNAKSVTVKKTSITLKKGKTYKVKATVKKVKKNKKLMPTNHARKLRYRSMNKKIATVNKYGTIKAKAKGKCIIYVYAHNGIGKLVNVTVK